MTIGLEDVKTPKDKKQILEQFEAAAEKVEGLFQKGVITDDERRQELIDIWTEATDKVKDAMEITLKADPFNPIEMMVSVGCPRKHHAGSPDRRHAWPGGQPEG